MTNLERIAERWKSTGLTKGVEDAHNLALCLQAQMNFNESTDAEARWRRVSIPVVRRLHAAECFMRNRFTNYFELDEHKAVLFFKTKFNPPNVSTYSLEAEAEYTAKLCEDLSKELNEIFLDKREAEIIFHGIGLLDEKTIAMYYS